jgi:C4-dicarboxylate transporter DctM subunit
MVEPKIYISFSILRPAQKLSRRAADAHAQTAACDGTGAAGHARADGGDGRHLWGIVTITEAAALAAVTAYLTSVIVYRGFPWTRTLEVVTEALASAGVIMLIIATALVFGNWMTGSGMPARFVDFAAHQGLATWQFLLVINVVLLIIGCFLEVVGTLLLVMPILAPVLVLLGVDPVHFGIIFTHNMEVGLVHPPVGLNLYVLSTISDAPVGEVIRGILPFLIILRIVLGLITYVPIMTLWLPNAIFG